MRVPLPSGTVAKALEIEVSPGMTGPGDRQHNFTENLCTVVCL